MEALRTPKTTPHIAVVANALTSDQGKLHESVCNEFDTSSVQGVTNILGAAYNFRFSELYDSFTSPDFQTTQLTQFTEFAQEVVNQRPLPFGSRVWCTYGFCSMTDKSEEWTECQRITVGNLLLCEEHFGTEFKLTIANKTDRNDFVVIPNMTLEQAKNKFGQELNLVQSVQPEAPKPVLTDKESVKADMCKLCISKGYRSGGAAYYHLIDIFDVFEAHKNMDLSDVMDIDLGARQVEIMSRKDAILEWSDGLVQKASDEQNPNLALYQSFGTFVFALLEKSVRADV